MRVVNRSSTPRQAPHRGEPRETYERLGVIDAERRFCAGLQAQYDSEVVYGHLQQELARQDILFTDTDSAVRDYPELLRRYFGTVVPPADNLFAAVNSAVWSGGAFVYVPSGRTATLPLHTYFRINAERIGQFEHTLIVLDAWVQHGDQAGHCPRRRTDGMDRREPRFTRDDGLSRGSPDRAGGTCRNVVTFTRQLRTTSGQGWKNHPCCCRHDQPDGLEIDLHARRTDDLSWIGADRGRKQTCEIAHRVQFPDLGCREPL
jgi:hypothetical protein